MQTRFGRSVGDAKGNGYLWQRHPEEVMQGDDRSMARIEAPKRRVQELALGERSGVVGHVHRVDRRDLDLDRAPTTAPNEVETGVDGQSVEPGVEAIRVA